MLSIRKRNHKLARSSHCLWFIITFFYHYHALADAIVIGVQELDYYPYSQVVDGQYQGFARDLFDAFAIQQQLDISFRSLPIKRLYQELVNKRIDFKFPDNPFWAKEDKKDTTLFYSDAIVGYIDGVLVTEKKRHIPRDQFLEVGFVRGFAPWTLMTDINEGKLKAREANSLKSLILLALNQRIDGAYFNIKVAKYQLSNKSIYNGELYFAEHLPHHKANYRMSTPFAKHQSLVSAFNQFLQSEQAAAIYQDYQLSVFPEQTFGAQ